MAKREFLQLAHVYDQKKHGIAGWFWSEKLDGMRCFWDGGCSTGMMASQVPWANTLKDARYVKPPVATGLWSRYGNVIHAPASLIGSLPSYPLDGELYCGLENFQDVTSICKHIEPDERWDFVKFMVFDTPPVSRVFADGEIDNTNFKKKLKGCRNFAENVDTVQEFMVFQDRLTRLKKIFAEIDNPNIVLHEQHRLPFKTADAEAEIERELDRVLDAKGEGLILKSPANLWLPERQHDVLKLKRALDAEGTVIGYTWGRETDKGSKLLGLMGNLILRQENGMKLEISGFTNEERQMEFCGTQDYGAHIREYGSRHPGATVDIHVAHNPHFPIGTVVSFRYSEVSREGVCLKARYWRKRPNE